MLRSGLLGLLLACSVSLGSSAVILDNGAPILWAQTSRQLSELPMLNGTVIPNAWNYLHRMSLLRLVIEATDANMGFIGSSGTKSPLWGLPLQLAWMLTSGTLMQNIWSTRGFLNWALGTCTVHATWLSVHSTGRLADPTGASTCGIQTGDPMCISTQSWWGCKHDTRNSAKERKRKKKCQMFKKMRFFLSSGVNYFSSVLPFLSAVQQGFMGAEVQVLSSQTIVEM